jgi:uncharacterized repeat protein (TIGR02543 family)
MKRKGIYTSTAVCLLALFIACNITGPEAGPVSGSDGKTAVRIGIEASGVQGRTVLPAAALADVTAWKLWGGKTSEPEALLEDFSGTGTTVYLETGGWHFTLNGYKNDDVILQGTIPSQTISPEGPNNLAFTVRPVLDGNGAFKITITLPGGHGITDAKVFKDGTQVDTLTPLADAVVFENDYAAGNYYFSFRLYKNSDLYGVVSEAVQVRAHLRSEKTYALGREDLNLTYVINYHLNDGQLGGDAANPDYYRSTDAGITLPIPTRTGYTFGGWHETSDCSDDSPVTDIPQGSMEDRDFYAQWTAVSYTVAYNANGGDGTMEPSSHTYDEARNLNANSFAKSGHVFAGWNTAVDGSGTNYANEAEVTNLTTTDGATVTLYARWQNEIIVSITVWANEDRYILYSTNDVVISKSGGHGMDKPTAFSPRVESPYANIQWELNGVPIGGSAGTAGNPTIRAADYDNGTYILGVTVTRNGIPYSTDIRFTVTN